MCFLSVLHLAVVGAGLVRHAVSAVQLFGLPTSCRESLGGQRGGVGAHIGDIATLVEPLRHIHDSLGGPSQPTTSLLLQRGSHKGGTGTASSWPLVNRGNRKVASSQVGHQLFAGGGIEHQHLLVGQLAVVIEILTAGNTLPID